MKLLRYGPKGSERPGLLDATGTIRSLRGVIDDVSGEALSRSAIARIREFDPSELPEIESQVRLGPCVNRIGKIMCIGQNYADHVKETGGTIPNEPKLFMKATSAVTGPFDEVMIPRGSERTDWEVELAIVIGETAKYVSEENALDYVAGYCVMNDISERSYQKERSGQWTKGKSCDTFAPLGPWLVTKDEIEDPQNLSLWQEVDGQRFQDSSTKEMIFGVRKLVSYLSEFMSLHPGDIISTGTPPGVGLGQSPPKFLQPGQTLRLGVQGLGEQHLTTIATP